MNEKMTLAEELASLDLEENFVDLAVARWKNPVADLLERGIYVFADAVTNDSVLKAKTELTLWGEANPHKDLDFIFASPGGVVFAGFGLYDQLWGMTETRQVTTRLRGKGASMGSILLQAASPGRRFVSKHSRVLVHPPSTYYNKRLNALDALYEANSMMDLWQHCLEVLTAQRGHRGPTAEQLERFVGRDDVWLTAIQATEEFHLADHIG
jgi:ATP-dependent Clp protease protease subunit